MSWYTHGGRQLSAGPLGGGIMRYSTLCLPIALLACATTIEHAPLDWQLVDHPEESRIELVYSNNTGRFGQASVLKQSVFLVVGTERFPIEDFNTGYCPGGDASGA